MKVQRPTATYFERLITDWSIKRLPVDVAMARHGNRQRRFAGFDEYLDAHLDSAALAINPQQPGRGHNGR